MITLVTIAIVISMALLLLRCITGPTTYDRILAANGFGTKTVVLIALLGFILDEMLFLDVALVYALINFITTVAFLKYFKDRSFAEE